MLICRNFSAELLDKPLDDAVMKTQAFENTRDMIKRWLEENNEDLVLDDVDDMIIAAVNEAMRAADAEAANNMSRLTGGLNLGGLF